MEVGESKYFRNVPSKEKNHKASSEETMVTNINRFFFFFLLTSQLFKSIDWAGKRSEIGAHLGASEEKPRLAEKLCFVCLPEVDTSASQLTY